MGKQSHAQWDTTVFNCIAICVLQYGCVALRMRFFPQNFGTIKWILPGSSSPCHREGPGTEVERYHADASRHLEYLLARAAILNTNYFRRHTTTRNVTSLGFNARNVTPYNVIMTSAHDVLITSGPIRITPTLNTNYFRRQTGGEVLLLSVVCCGKQFHLQDLQEELNYPRDKSKPDLFQSVNVAITKEWLNSSGYVNFQYWSFSFPTQVTTVVHLHLRSVYLAVIL